MWTWRKMTRTSWTEHKTNEAVLNEINEERPVMNAIVKRTIKLIGGRLLRRNAFVTIVMEGKRSRGRPRESFFEEIYLQPKSQWGRHVTDMIGYNNESLEADGDRVRNLRKRGFKHPRVRTTCRIGGPSVNCRST